MREGEIDIRCSMCGAPAQLAKADGALCQECFDEFLSLGQALKSMAVFKDIRRTISNIREEGKQKTGH